MNEELIVLTITVLVLLGFWRIVPRCPECGFIVSVRDALDPSLRHCRRCLSIFRTEKRP